MTEYGELPDEKPKRDDKFNCLKCKHFKITWNVKSPRACAVFGFKGKELPSVTVLRLTGKPCPCFEPKNK